ncbi:MAG: hypothetical protein J7L55_05295 [Desulfurococcales archaeon]|nr:hypothetical protein [Desulfurococcales archaeon]
MEGANLKGPSSKADVKLVNVFDLERVIAFIPPGHTHTRVLIKFKDGSTLIFQQAVIDGIIRTFLDVALHPENAVSEFVPELIPKDRRKPGFAKWQLMPSLRDKGEVMRDAVEALRKTLQDVG